MLLIKIINYDGAKYREYKNRATHTNEGSRYTNSTK